MRCHAFTLQDQLRFAELSGDYNPLHIDKIAARRLMFGSVIVHGIHTLLWGLDTWLQGKTEHVELRSLNAVFLKPVRLGDEVRYSQTSKGQGHVEIDLRVGDSAATNLKFAWIRSRGCTSGDLPASFPRSLECRELSATEAEKASGSLQLYLNVDSSSSCFENLGKWFSQLQIAQLLATSRLVGMECPGLHSLYSSLDVAFGRETEESRPLTYEVKKLDTRFGLVLLDVASASMTGTVKAFLRPSPQEQLAFCELREHVKRREFANQRALVVGGSRGLGEVTAKLLAAGGADVRITYFRGAEKARRVVDEITSGGGSADSRPFDVLDDRTSIVQRLGVGWAPTHLYYFPTPYIAAGMKGTFSMTLFQRFCDYYLTGFQKVVEHLSSLGLMASFYPSSVYVDEVPLNMGEYAAAKVAGEVLCTYLEKTQGVRIYAPRLPRMATDQTASILPTRNEDPAFIMIEYLRKLEDPSPTKHKE